MYDIYAGHAVRYDELVDREDWQGNLGRVLMDTASWDNAVVVEAGVGTGRVSRLFLDRVARLHAFDRSSHMLGRATENLARWSDRIDLAMADNTDLPVEEQCADVFVEGWAFGHTVGDNDPDVVGTTERLVSEALRVCRTGGTVILIETLGTNSETPGPPTDVLGKFYDLLERVHGFARTTVRTDYRFTNVEEAIRVCGFFFGDAMAEALRQRFAAAKPAPEGAIVPEYTGVWHRTR
jgi:ubiquinone/menaquinone biosynthesis C-methylase UbiE